MSFPTPIPDGCGTASAAAPHVLRALARLGAAVAVAIATPWAAQAQAQPEGGLYIAGYGFSFVQAAQQGLAQNPAGRRFFVLALPPNTEALTRRASRQQATTRERAVARGGVLLVCQRDVDSGAVRAADLVPGVVAVRGFPPPGSADIPPGERYFPGEDGSRLPQSNTALRRLRSTCS
jgi:hypothetical protein